MARQPLTYWIIGAFFSGTWDKYGENFEEKCPFVDKQKALTLAREVAKRYVPDRIYILTTFNTGEIELESLQLLEDPSLKPTHPRRPYGRST